VCAETAQGGAPAMSFSLPPSLSPPRKLCCPLQKQQEGLAWLPDPRRLGLA